MRKLEKVITGYGHYLAQKGFVESNVKKYSSRARDFVKWLEKRGIDRVTYTELMDYIDYSRKESRSNATINTYLLSIRHLFDYLDSQGDRWLNPTPGFNPALNLQVRGVHRKVFHDPLNKEELESLYQRYTGKDKVLAGLLVYQGLKTGEVEKLEKRYLDLSGGHLYVPSTINGSRRTLKLAAEQILLLVEQLQYGPDELLLGPRLQNRIRQVMKKLRKLNPKVRTAGHLRGSLIVHWIKTRNLRQAQYLAGHKTILSTELYQQSCFEDLKEQLNRHHPLDQFDPLK